MALPDGVSEALFSDATLTLGKIHWTLLRASNLMNSLRYREVKKEGQFFHTTEWTDLGHEIGMDEINWWVFKREPQIGELLAETERALAAAQVLKTESAKLENLRPESYDDLLITLKNFAENHRQEIELIYAYVRWLEARDPMAPKILFSYRVWGSTRMGDRAIKMTPDAPSIPDLHNMQICSELVLGLRDYLWTTYERMHTELSYEIWESMDPEQISEDTEISIPIRRVIARVRRKA